MKTYTLIVYSSLCLIAINSCSTGDSSNGKKSSSIIIASRNPQMIELNRDLQPLKAVKIVADINDLGSEITEVTLRFDDVPVTVLMQKAHGTLWEAQLTARQIEMMAVSGQIAKYGAQIIAKNAEGEVSTSEKPVIVAVKAPNQARAASL